MAAPNRVTVRAYQVGFGDCFLVTFHYARQRARHVLIDFGSTASPKGAPAGHLAEVARSIAGECGNKLDAIVATHRHRDHVSGFATARGGKGPGDLIRALDPEVVVQPWTEHPDAQSDATAAPGGFSADSRTFTASLLAMHGAAEAVRNEAQRRLDALDAGEEAGPRVSKTLAQHLRFMGETNLANLSAVKNLMAMGKRRHYVHHGSESGLEDVLPGVGIRVLGPPSLEQSQTIRSQRSRDENEFWHFQALAGRTAGGRLAAPFAGAAVFDAAGRPRASRWLMQRMQTMRGDQMLEIVRILDKVLNNTSVILLFEIGGEKLLFPGDAQIENWRYALEGPAGEDNRKLLERVTFYKVGHHGSLNATPKSLWRGFARRSADESDPRRLRTVVSTLRGKHGSSHNETEVPRKTLVAALESESRLLTTERVKAADLFEPVTIEI